MKNINCPDIYRLYSQQMKESYNVVYLDSASAVFLTLIQHFINKLLQITIIMPNYSVTKLFEEEMCKDFKTTFKST